MGELQGCYDNPFLNNCPIAQAANSFDFLQQDKSLAHGRAISSKERTTQINLRLPGAIFQRNDVGRRNGGYAPPPPVVPDSDDFSINCNPHPMKLVWAL
ncbi:predicted protein [Uncinocarpus reesii 1704]|uniref:Uncharacterized protein n=1 Tax=Uncinocarpus reesii (strain UAMH 1704) TaxID=336963 RepID=C4JP56_UNCRE|nr:uncharacterized protein UREG_03115 [Uncinocarpus reesii 1704]EEP78270.1 predicted protein [Uncinocarpus reesii 1704]